MDPITAAAFWALATAANPTDRPTDGSAGTSVGVICGVVNSETQVFAGEFCPPLHLLRRCRRPTPPPQRSENVVPGSGGRWEGQAKTWVDFKREKRNINNSNSRDNSSINNSKDKTFSGRTHSKKKCSPRPSPRNYFLMNKGGKPA